MNIRQDSLLRKEDLLAIEEVLYKVKEDELIARQIATVNINYPAYANEIGYDWYSRRGSAKIIGSGASANDVPFVGEDGGRETARVYTIVTGIRFEENERFATQARNALGKGPSVSIDTLRVASARRFVAEKENQLFFVGDSSFNIYGILNKPGIICEDVADASQGKNKRSWADKTPKEILKDLLAGKVAVEKDGFFKAKVLIITPEAKGKLLQPYSEQSPMTIMKWLESEGMYFEKILETRALKKEYNKLGSDAFSILDNDPEVLELVVPQDIILGEPVYDILNTSEQVVKERTAGAIIRHPSAIYVGKGI